jgi:hypothetical protein
VFRGPFAFERPTPGSPPGVYWRDPIGRRALVQRRSCRSNSRTRLPITTGRSPRETDALGRIRPKRVLQALEASGAEEIALILEIIPPFEADDDQVLQDLVASAERWRVALARSGSTS